MLVLDAGNFSFSGENLSKKAILKELPQAKMIAETYNLLPYNIVNIGLFDLIGGYDFLKHIQNSAKNYQVISANLYNSKNQQLIFNPHKIVKIDSLKIGIVGITSQPRERIKGIEVQAPLKILREEVEYLQSEVEVDYIVLLAALNHDDYMSLRKSEIPIDIVLMALPNGRSSYLTETMGKIIARAGTEGKYIGYLSAIINDNKNELTEISYASYKKSFVERRIDNYKKAAGDTSIENYLADKDRIRRVYNNLVVTRDELKRRIEEAPNPVEFELIPVELSTRKKEKVQKSIDKFRK